MVNGVNSPGVVKLSPKSPSPDFQPLSFILSSLVLVYTYKTPALSVESSLSL